MIARTLRQAVDRDPSEDPRGEFGATVQSRANGLSRHGQPAHL